MNTSNDPFFFLLGCNHQTAPLNVRERFSISNDQQVQLYSAFRQIKNLSECLILNTCNRLELYGVANHPDAKHQMLEQFYKIHSLTNYDFEPHKYLLKNNHAVQHLFEVASGINSQIIGETEIFGQVKSSYLNAQKYETTGKILHHTLQKCFQAVKWVRTNTSIGNGQVSIGSVATDLALRIFQNLQNTRILIIGSGEVAEATIQSLRFKGGNDITVTNRTFQKAHLLAEKFQGMALDFSNFHKQLHLFDVIITSTSSSSPILTPNLIQSALNQRPSKPLFLIDLSVPRNISPSTANLHNTYLYNIDDLALIANQNLSNRKNEITKCRSFLQEKANLTYLSLFNPHPPLQHQATLIS